MKLHMVKACFKWQSILYIGKAVSKISFFSSFFFLPSLTFEQISKVFLIENHTNKLVTNFFLFLTCGLNFSLFKFTFRKCYPNSKTEEKSSLKYLIFFKNSQLNFIFQNLISWGLLKLNLFDFFFFVFLLLLMQENPKL